MAKCWKWVRKRQWMGTRSDPIMRRSPGLDCPSAQHAKSADADARNTAPLARRPRPVWIDDVAKEVPENESENSSVESLTANMETGQVHLSSSRQISVKVPEATFIFDPHHPTFPIVIIENDAVSEAARRASIDFVLQNFSRSDPMLEHGQKRTATSHSRSHSHRHSRPRSQSVVQKR